MDYKIQNAMLWHLTDSADWQQVEFYPTPNKGGKIVPKFLVIHFTAGSSDARATAQYFQKPNAKASAHLTLDLDGTYVQNVEFDVKAWHAGKSQWAGSRGLNNNSIGIEVVNPGPLTITNNGEFKTWWGKTMKSDDIVVAPHQNNPNGPEYGWIPFTEHQVNALIGVGQELMREYRLLECVVHDMISPGRKFDPGPCMSHRVYEFINNDVNDNAGDYEWQVNVANTLNGRGGPGTSYPVMKELNSGEFVDVLERNGLWWFVDTSDGKDVWVHSKFLKMVKVDNDS
jgi:N-acetylmuramoyl-L-alanine amidase